MNCKEKLVLDALLEQLSTAHNWKVSLSLYSPFNPIEFIKRIAKVVQFTYTDSRDVFSLRANLKW